MEEKKLQNVHVCLYGHDMLKEALHRLIKNDMPFDKEIHYDFLSHENTYLVLNNGVFKVVQDPTPNHSIEVSLNYLFELIADTHYSVNDSKVGKIIILQEPKIIVGDYIFTELKNSKDIGFSLFQVSRQDTADFHNSIDCKHTSKIITKDIYDDVRRVFD